MNVELGGEPIELLPQRAAYWPRRRSLVVADVHFGKAATFRSHGIPVPRGTTGENLAALDALLVSRDIEELIFLGDFLHARQAQARATLDAIRHWRRRHPALRLVLVRGNHDIHAGDPPPDLDILAVDEPHRVGPIAFCHHPQRVSGHFAIGGHLHPVYTLRAGHERIRLPCFVLGVDTCVLPAFGAFTGGLMVRAREGERILLAAPDRVWEVPRRQPGVDSIAG